MRHKYLALNQKEKEKAKKSARIWLSKRHTVWIGNVIMWLISSTIYMEVTIHILHSPNGNKTNDNENWIYFMWIVTMALRHTHTHRAAPAALLWWEQHERRDLFSLYAESSVHPTLCMVKHDVLMAIYYEGCYEVCSIFHHKYYERQ